MRRFCWHRLIVIKETHTEGAFNNNARAAVHPLTEPHASSSRGSSSCEFVWPTRSREARLLNDEKLVCEVKYKLCNHCAHPSSLHVPTDRHHLHTKQYKCHPISAA